MFPVVWLQNPMLIFQNCLLWLKTSFPDVSAPSAPKFSRLLLPVSFFQGDIDVSLRPQGDIDRWSVKCQHIRAGFSRASRVNKRLQLNLHRYQPRSEDLHPFVSSRMDHQYQQNLGHTVQISADSSCSVEFHPNAYRLRNAMESRLGLPQQEECIPTRSVKRTLNKILVRKNDEFTDSNCENDRKGHANKPTSNRGHSRIDRGNSWSFCCGSCYNLRNQHRELQYLFSWKFEEQKIQKNTKKLQTICFSIAFTIGSGTFRASRILSGPSMSGPTFAILAWNDSVEFS